MQSATVTNRQKFLGLVAVLLGQFMLVLDATVVNVALPAIKADLALTPGQLTWVTDAYMIAFGGLLLLFGRLGDELGRRRVLQAGLLMFTVSSVACGLAPNALTLVAARFVQGVGAAAASSVILAIISTMFPSPAERTRAMSGYMFVSVSGGSLGLFVGGLLTQLLSWHWIFWINLPVGLIAMKLAHTSLRDQPPGERKGPLDVAGAVLVTGAAMALIYGLVEASHASWLAPASRIAFAAAIVLGVSFFVVESTRANPLLPLRMLRIRSLVVTSIVRGFMAMGLFGVFILATLDMAHALGFGPFKVGLAFLPQTLTVAALSLGGTARLVRRFGAERILIVGLGLAAIGLGVLALLDLDEPYFPLRALAHVLLGLGFGMCFLPLLTISMSEVPAADAGLGSAIVNLSMQLSAAVGIAVLVTLSTSRAHALAADGMPVHDALIHGFRLGYSLSIVALLIGMTLAAVVLRRPRR